MVTDKKQSYVWKSGGGNRWSEFGLKRADDDASQTDRRTSRFWSVLHGLLGFKTFAGLSLLLVSLGLYLVEAGVIGVALFAILLPFAVAIFAFGFFQLVFLDDPSNQLGCTISLFILTWIALFFVFLWRVRMIEGSRP